MTAPIRSSRRSLSSAAVLQHMVNPTPAAAWCVFPIIQLIISAAIAAVIGVPWVYLLAVVIVAASLFLPWLIRLRLARSARTTNMAATPSQPVSGEREEVIRRMSPEASAIIAATTGALRARYNAPEVRTEFYVCRCQDPARYRCRCGVVRLSASILPSTTGWPMLVVGDLLTAFPDQLRFVLAHELQHHTRPHRRFLRGRELLNELLWFVLGLLTPLAYLPAIAVAAWTTLMASAWIEEVICDVVAARRYSGAGWCNAALDAQRRAPLLPYLPLPPLYPPLRVRAWYIRRISCRRT